MRRDQPLRVSNQIPVASTDVCKQANKYPAICTCLNVVADKRWTFFREVAFLLADARRPTF